MAKTKRRSFLYVAALLLLAGSLLFVFRGPILTAVGQWVIVSDPLEKSDAIAVLSGHSAARGAKAAETFFQGWAPKILITKGQYPYRIEELERYGIYIPDAHEEAVGVLKYLKVPDTSVEVLDGYNDSTLSEARRYLPHMQNHGLRRLIVVTSCYHTRRARLIFRRIFKGSGISVSVQPAPPNFEYNPEGWWTRRDDTRSLLFEYQKLIFYALRYW